MRGMMRVSWPQQLSARSDEAIEDVPGDVVPRDKDRLIVLGDRDEAMVEHPVQGS